MFKLSNKHELEYLISSGALGFDGLGWFWEKILIWLGFMKLELFTIVLRTITYEPRLYPVSNFSWWRPWTWIPWSPHSCVRLLGGNSVVNKVGLWNHGIHHFVMEIAPRLDFKRYALVASIWGTKEELVAMTKLLNGFPFKAIELNVSCPNTGHKNATEQIVEAVEAVKQVSRHPLILKLSADQVDKKFLAISGRLCGQVQAFSLNSVPWNKVFPEKTSPMEKIGKPGSGKGGVSGRAAQKANWEAMGLLTLFGHSIPVIAPSIISYDDLAYVRKVGAKAVSFGAIHLPDGWKFWTIFTNPCKPTRFVRQEQRRRALEFS